MAKTTVLARISCFGPVEKLCITLRTAWNLGVDGGFQGGHFVGGEVCFDGLRGVVQGCCSDSGSMPRSTVPALLMGSDLGQLLR